MVKVTFSMQIGWYFLVLDYKRVWIVPVGHLAVFISFSCHCLLTCLGILRQKPNRLHHFFSILTRDSWNRGHNWLTTCLQEKIFSVDLKTLLDRKYMTTPSKVFNYSHLKISSSQYFKAPSVRVPLPKQCNLKWPLYLTCWITCLKVSFLPYGSEFEKYITAIPQTQITLNYNYFFLLKTTL